MYRSGAQQKPDDRPEKRAEKDRFGRNHYEETNSTGRNTARTILNETDKEIVFNDILAWMNVRIDT